MAVQLDDGVLAVWIIVTVLLLGAVVVQALLLSALKQEVRGSVLSVAFAAAFPCCARPEKKEHMGSSLSLVSSSSKGGKTESKRLSMKVAAKAVKKEWEVDVNKLKMKYTIGKGNFGEVWLATWLGSPVAVKTLLSKLQAKENIVKRFMDEIYMMSVLHHPNVVLFLGACVTRPNLCLVLEYCVHGSLHHFLKSEHKHGVRITMALVYRFALDIARGVYYLHRKQSIVQRDLKARNILVDESLNGKVADFGLSRVLDDAEQNKLTACGTPAWTAPEVVRLEAYTDKVDVYSFGIILWELLTRDEPYGGRKGVQIAYAAAEQGLRPEVPSYCPEDYRDLMTECWADNPDDRPSFDEILKRLFLMKKTADGRAAGIIGVGAGAASDPLTRNPRASVGGEPKPASPTKVSAGDRKGGSGTGMMSDLSVGVERAVAIGSHGDGGLSMGGTLGAHMGVGSGAPLQDIMTPAEAQAAVDRGIVAAAAHGGTAGEWDGDVGSDDEGGVAAVASQSPPRQVDVAVTIDDSRRHTATTPTSAVAPMV